jgi:nucleotide-binding universal stress UspA family protein
LWQALLVLLLNAAKDVSADLIVIGTHAHHGFVRALLGSVSERVLRASVIPVLAVPPWRV